MGGNLPGGRGSHGAGRPPRRWNLSGNVTIGRRSRSGKTNRADHDENDGISVAKRKIATAHLVEQKKHANGDDDRRPHQPANRTSTACASNPLAHRINPPTNAGPA